MADGVGFVIVAATYRDLRADFEKRRVRLPERALEGIRASRRRGSKDAYGDSGSRRETDRKSTRLNSSHGYISYAVFCLKKKHAREGVPPACSSIVEQTTH